MMNQERRICEFYRLKDNCWWLNKSFEIKTSNIYHSRCAFVALKIHQSGQLLICSAYASANSPIDCLTGCPAEIIHKKIAAWEEHGESNKTLLKSRSSKEETGGKISVTTNYDFPEIYTGPPYRQRIVTFDSDLRPLKVAMTYKNGRTDIGMISYDEETAIIEWTLASGYLNQGNANFF